MKRFHMPVGVTPIATSFLLELSKAERCYKPCWPPVRKGFHSPRSTLLGAGQRSKDPGSPSIPARENSHGGWVQQDRTPCELMTCASSHLQRAHSLPTQLFVSFPGLCTSALRLQAPSTVAITIVPSCTFLLSHFSLLLYILVIALCSLPAAPDERSRH